MANLHVPSYERSQKIPPAAFNQDIQPVWKNTQIRIILGLQLVAEYEYKFGIRILCEYYPNTKLIARLCLDKTNTRKNPMKVLTLMML